MDIQIGRSIDLPKDFPVSAYIQALAHAANQCKNFKFLSILYVDPCVYCIVHLMAKMNIFLFRTNQAVSDRKK